MGKILVGLAGLAVGAALGYYVCHRHVEDKEYRLVREDQRVELQLKETGRSYPLTQIGKDFYLGDSDHNLKGVQAMGRYEGRNGVDPAQQEGKLEVTVQEKK